MALPREYVGFEDALNIVAEIVSTCIKVPGPGSLTVWGIKEVLNDFPIQNYKLKRVLTKKNVKSLGIPDDKYEFVLEQTRDALSSIDSVDYNPAVFRKEVFTKNYYFPTLIGSELVEKLHIDEDADLLKAVRFVIAVYLIHWTEEKDFSLETRQELYLLKTNVMKNSNNIVDIYQIIESLKARIKELENANRGPIPIELTVIPKSITNLIGRESVIQDITAKLETNHVLCLTADGGLGKTAIAKHIINKIRADIRKDGCIFMFVAWITSSRNLKESLLQINIPTFATDDQENKFKKVCRFLQSNPTFLVIDNMDELPKPDEINILNTISGMSTILITSRAAIDCFPAYELQPLDRDTAVAVFYNHYHHNSAIADFSHEKINEEISTGRIKDVYKIVDATGGNALIIELLAKTAHADHMSVTELWEKFGSGILGVDSKTGIQTDHSANYSEFKLSIDEQMRKLYSMLKLTDKQKEIMSFISLFPAEHDIFSDVFKWADFFDQGANDMMYLVERGWIIREDNFYSIHTIVRDSINIQNNKSGDVVSILKYENLLVELTNIDNYIPQTMEYTLAQKLSFVPQTVGKLLIGKKNYNISIGTFFHKLAELYYCQGIYGESLRYYKRSLIIFEKKYGKDHLITSDIYNDLAELYRAQGNCNEALKYFNKALRIRENTLGKNHPDIATTYNGIACTYSFQHNYDQALRYFYMALEIRENTLGKNHTRTAIVYDNLANLYYNHGNYEDALKYYNKALDILENTLGKDHPDTAITYENIACLYNNQGNYDDALKYFNKALMIQENKLGKNHPETAATYNNLAALYFDHCNYDDALKYFNMAREIRENALDKNHPETAVTYDNIAKIYYDQGNYDDALKHFNKALEIRENTLGKDHPVTATTYSNIASIYYDQGNYDDALKHFNKALEIRENTLGKNHPDTVTTYDNLAKLYMVQGDFGELQKYCKILLEIHEKALGKYHPETATLYNNLASVYFGLANYNEAIKNLNTALKIRKKILGNEHPETAATYDDLAVIYRTLGNYDETQKCYKAALKIRENTLGKNHPVTVMTYGNLAELYINQRDYKNAQKYYKILLEINEITLGKYHPYTATTYDFIARTYYKQGNYDQALNYFNMALEIRENTLGKDHPDTIASYDSIAFTYEKNGNYDQALKYFNMALEIRENTLSKDHPDIAATYNNLGNIFNVQGKYDEALTHFNYALEIFKKVNGIHPYTAKVYENLANTYNKMGNFEESQKHRDMAEKIRKKLGDQ